MIKLKDPSPTPMLVMTSRNEAASVSLRILVFEMKNEHLLSTMTLYVSHSSAPAAIQLQEACDEVRMLQES